MLRLHQFNSIDYHLAFRIQLMSLFFFLSTEMVELKPGQEEAADIWECKYYKCVIGRKENIHF